ncbi:hypothetical protein D3C80_2172070 [compost metagenome]
MINKRELTQLREAAENGESLPGSKTLKLLNDLTKLKEEVRFLKKDNADTIKAIMNGNFEV